MKRSRAGDGLMQLAARALLCALCASAAIGQTGKEGAANAAEEKFEAIDPYTKGKPELVKQAGYVSLEPFIFAEGIQPQDMVEVLGGIDLVWAETAHFKICSSLKTYRSKADQQENDAIDRDIAQLARKVSTFRNERGSKLDPWLRLHLYALRLERLYTEFCQRTGFSEAEFPPAGTKNAMGSGPWLGQPLKPTVLLAEKSSTLGRFTRQYTKKEESYSQRYLLPGGSMFFGISAEALRDNGFELDNALHCAVAASVVSNFLDALRGNGWASPLWLNVGMAHWFSRRIDHRFNFFAHGTSKGEGDERWNPRVRALVDKKFEFSWDEMLALQDWSQITPQAHLLIWSRMDWMIDHGPPAMRKFLEPVTVKLSSELSADRAKAQVERAKAGLAAAGFGKTTEECDAAWRAWVRKHYDR